eukprot:1536412-Prymnesium_polylepis.1
MGSHWVTRVAWGRMGSHGVAWGSHGVAWGRMRRHVSRHMASLQLDRRLYSGHREAPARGATQ